MSRERGTGGEGITRRRLVTGGAALALATFTPWLGGCGRNTPATTLRVQLRLNPYEQSFFERVIVPPFARARHVDVQFAGGTIDETLEAIRNGADRYDLLAVDTEAVGGLIAEGIAHDVSVERDRLDNAIFASIPAAVTSGGKLYALPYRPAAWITYANTALLAAANVRQPATWDDLYTAAEQLRDQSGNGLVALQGAAGAPAAQTLLELIWAFGGDPLAPVDAGARAAGEYLARLGPRLAPLSRDGKIDSLTTALGADRAAIGPNWPAVAEDLLQRGGKRELVTYAGPTGPAGLARLISGQVLLAPRNAPNPDGALALAAHLRSLDVQRTCSTNLAWIPARDDAFGAAPAWQQGVATATRQALHAARAIAPVRDRAAFDAILSDACRAIAFDGKPPQDALAQAAERLRAIQ
ncbi:MAG: extracellular solute-binding protein [Thermomicrobiales bacterium]